MKEEPLTIKFNISEVTNMLLLHLKETTDCLTHIYYAIEKTDSDIFRPLPTNNLPLGYDDKKPRLTNEEQRLITLNWALMKAFEDFINGLTKSLKLTYKYLFSYKLSLEPPHTRTKEQVKIKLQKIATDIEKFNFPDLITEIEKLLGKKLLLKKEILSINKVRNCLVHRHGTVNEKDIAYSKEGDLRLRWISLELSTEVDGEKTEITYNLRKNGLRVHKLYSKTTDQEHIFNVGDKVLIDIDEFNSISFTCAMFATELQYLLPMPQNTNY